MSDLLYVAILTSPAYVIPLIWSFVRKGAVAASFFFAYSFLGTWLFSLLLAVGIISPNQTVAPWAIRIDDFSWYAFAAINVGIFAIQLSGTTRPAVERIIRRRRVQLLAYTTLLLIILYVALSVVANGGLAAWAEASYRRVALDNSLINYMFPVATFTLVSSVVLYTLSRRITLKRSTRVTIITLCLVQVLVAAVSGGRSVVLLYLVSLVIAHGKAKLPRWVIYGCTATVVVFASGAMIYERYQQQEADASFLLSTRSIVEASYTGLPYIDHFELAKEYVNINGHDLGKAYISLLVLPIPRALWEEKPIQLSREFRSEFWGDTSGGIPPGLFGEAYVAFGWGGVLAVTLALGWLLRYLSNTYPAKSSRAYLISVVAVTGSAIGFILVRGGMDIGVYRVGLIVLSLWVVCRLVYARKSACESASCLA